MSSWETVVPRRRQHKKQDHLRHFRPPTRPHLQTLLETTSRARLQRAKSRSGHSRIRASHTRPRTNYVTASQRRRVSSDNNLTSFMVLAHGIFPGWTQGLTWTKPRISSNTFEVEIQLCANYGDDDGPPVCAQNYSETFQVKMPYKVLFNRNMPANVRKYEKIFISRETPELYW